MAIRKDVTSRLVPPATPGNALGSRDNRTTSLRRMADSMDGLQWIILRCSAPGTASRRGGHPGPFGTRPNGLRPYRKHRAHTQGERHHLIRGEDQSRTRRIPRVSHRDSPAGATLRHYHLHTVSTRVAAPTLCHVTAPSWLAGIPLCVWRISTSVEILSRQLDGQHPAQRAARAFGPCVCTALRASLTHVHPYMSACAK